MAAADFALRVTTDPDGRLSELHLSSPTGSPRRSPQRPLRPALKPAVQPRRVQWAARNQVHTFSSSEAEEGMEEDEEHESQQHATAAGRSSRSSGSRQHQAMQPGSPGWHSPPQAAHAKGAQQQPALYSTPAMQPHAQQQYWDAATAAAAYYQHYGWPSYQQPAPGHGQQAPPVPQPAAQPEMQAREVQQQQQQPPQQQPLQQQPPLPQHGLSFGVGQSSMDCGTSALDSPTLLQVHAGSVHITIDSPDVKMQGMRAHADPSAGEQRVPPAKPAGCSAGTQTEACAEVPPAQAPVSSTASQQQQVPAPQLPLLPPQTLPPQQPQAELPPGIPAGQPAQQPWLPEQRQEWQRQGSSSAAPMPPLRLPPKPSTAAGSAPPLPQQGAAAAGPAYDRDVSSLGRLQASDSYWEGDGPATGGSLSSGLSPRESRPRQQEWDHAEAIERLAAQATAYGHAMRQQLRGKGPVSATDALPARLAAQQLASLAGMSRKVRLLWAGCWYTLR